MSSVYSMVLFTKPLHLIHLSKMELLKEKNRTLKDMMNAMLISSGLLQNLWGEGMLFANYILNKLPRKKTKKTPHELWKGNEYLAGKALPRDTCEAFCFANLSSLKHTLCASTIYTHITHKCEESF